MDSTLTTGRSQRRAQERNGVAFRRLAGSYDCPFCSHDIEFHLMTSGQPHFFSPATDDDYRRWLASEGPNLSRVEDGRGRWVKARRHVVARGAELQTLFCRACAQELSTDQVMCFQRTLAVGELVGGARTEREAGCQS